MSKFSKNLGEDNSTLTLIPNSRIPDGSTIPWFLKQLEIWSSAKEITNKNKNKQKKTGDMER